MTLDPFLSPVGMRCLPPCSGCDKPSPGPSAWAVILRCRARQQNLAGWLVSLHNPPCMAAPCCPPFAQGGSGGRTAKLRCRARQVRCRKAKTAPLCKGSCRRTPTEGLTASRRTQAVLPHPTIENQLNHSPGFTIPPDMAAAPRRHKGGFSLPRWTQPAFFCTLPGLHNSPFRQSRSTGARNPYSRGEYGGGDTPPGALRL